MELTHPQIGMFAAVAAGLLVGLERGYSQRLLDNGQRVAGFRTFGLIGLLGGVAGLVPDAVAFMLAAGLVAVLAIGYAKSTRLNQLSATTTIAGLLTFVIGMAATRLSPTVALAGAAVMFAILSARQSMHSVLKGLDTGEIEAASRFVLVALVVLPLLPDANLGPYDAWNPRRIWMVVVFVMGVSFVGYVAARRFGQGRGILLVALTGSLVSSTAVTADYARRLRSEPGARGALTAGIAVASIVMFVRVQLLALVLVPRAVPSLALAMAPATIVGTLFGLLAWRGRATQASSAGIANPLGFGAGLFLAGLVAILSLAARWAHELLGSRGIALLLGLTGLSDVDAAVMTMAGLPAGTLDDHTAGLVLAVPILANTAIKAGMTMAIGRGHGGLRAAIPLIAALFASGLAVAAWSLA